MTSGPSITLFILTRDRPAFLEQTLKSAVAQSTRYTLRLLVSDNSDGDETERMMAEQYPSIPYRRCRPSLPSLGHFRLLLDSVDSDYFMMFHDDDILEPHFVENTVDLLETSPELAAVGANARILLGECVTARTFMGPLARTRRVDGARTIIDAYFGIGKARPAPFPAYMYRTAATRGLFLDPLDGGKYADVAFLLKLAARGPILWLADPLVRYRIHASNDSGEVNIAQQLRLLRFARRMAPASLDGGLLEEVRFLIYYRWLAAGRRSTQLTPRRRRVVLRHMLAHMPLRLIIPALYSRLFSYFPGSLKD